MADKLIFLSHIHEEQELALLVKKALESEFAGFVDVFVSSDGVSIPTGTNFLRKIESGLLNCIGAVYLISPNSLGRSWISFELGAVWARNAINVRDNKSEIPIMPFCHSGCVPSSLPVPLNILTAIEANNAGQLSLAFGSMQKAVDGKGALRTDFDGLSRAVALFEKKYTVGKNLTKLFDILGISQNDVENHFLQTPAAQSVTIQGIVEAHRTGEMRQVLGDLSGLVTYQEGAHTVSTVATNVGVYRRSGAKYEVTLPRGLLGSVPA